MAAIEAPRTLEQGTDDFSERRASSKSIDIVKVNNASAEPEGLPLLCRSCPEQGHFFSKVNEVNEEEEEEDCCSICLDPFTDENPAKVTKCRHQYHLQCIMQWYQRSQTCPLCFKKIELENSHDQKLLEMVGGGGGSERARPPIAMAPLIPSPRMRSMSTPEVYRRDSAVPNLERARVDVGVSRSSLATLRANIKKTFSRFSRNRNQSTS